MEHWFIINTERKFLKDQIVCGRFIVNIQQILDVPIICLLSTIFPNVYFLYA